MNNPARLPQTLSILLLAAALGGLSACSTTDKQPEQRNLNTVQVSQERERPLAMLKTALDKLYATDPDARAVVRGAVGYGVFDITTVNALLVVGARGPRGSPCRPTGAAPATTSIPT